MQALTKTRRLLCLCAFFAIIGGSVFLALYPKKIHREELDMQRIVEADALEAAFEQYLLHQATRAQREKEQPEDEEVL